MPTDYWLVEISGIPFGLTSEMLNHRTGGSPYRGMRRLWDQFGMQDAEWLGHLDPHRPLKTDQPSVLATVYRKPGKSLIALGDWPAACERGAASPGPCWWPLSL